MTTKAKSQSAELAEAVADEIAKQHRELVIRTRPDIQRLLDQDGEIKVTFGTVLTNRPAEEGTVASKDSRILTTVHFSLGKLSEKIESAFPDPEQMELGEKE